MDPFETTVTRMVAAVLTLLTVGVIVWHTVLPNLSRVLAVVK